MYYKLTDEKMQTYGDFQWALNEWHEIPPGKRGKGFCTDNYFHLYDDPLLAVLLNSIHANFKKLRMFEAETEGPVESDKGLKFGAVKMRLVREIDVPEITIEQRVRFAILCAVEVHNDAGFNTWAQDWLSGKDKTAATAAAREAATWKVWATATTTGWAARAATWAAGAAGWEAAAVWVARPAWAARVVTWAARAAARAADAKDSLDFKALAAKAIKESEARK